MLHTRNTFNQKRKTKNQDKKTFHVMEAPKASRNTYPNFRQSGFQAKTNDQKKQRRPLHTG